MARQRIEKSRETGIYRVHERGCESSPCRCVPKYQAAVYSAVDAKMIRKHFPSLKEAQLWRGEAVGALATGKMRAPTKRTVAEAADELLAGMRDGSITTRSRTPYKPAAIRSYERALRLRLLPTFGRRRLSEVQRAEVQRFAEALVREGMSASTVRNTLDPLRVIYRRATRMDEVHADPTQNLDIPAARGRRTRIESPARALDLIDALPMAEQAFWAVALFVGLRRGELRALRWSDVDLSGEPATISVDRTWDDEEGEVTTKSEAGRRSVPLPNLVKHHLILHGLSTARTGDDLVFGATAGGAFCPSTVRRRARKAWKLAGLEPLTPHEARHCAASFLIDQPNVSDLQLTRLIGHSDVRTTKNIYGHLLPDSGAQVAASMDAFLDAAQEARG